VGNFVVGVLVGPMSTIVVSVAVVVLLVAVDAVTKDTHNYTQSYSIQLLHCVNFSGLVTFKQPFFLLSLLMLFLLLSLLLPMLHSLVSDLGIKKLLLLRFMVRFGFFGMGFIAIIAPLTPPPLLALLEPSKFHLLT